MLGLKGFFHMALRMCLYLFVVAALGCGKAELPTAAAPAADHEDVPITEADVRMPSTYAEALPQIKGYRDAIRTAIEAGKPGKAHRALDELDIVLHKLPSIAKDSGIAIEQWETINLTARELRDSFNQLHSAIDDNRPPDYKAVAEPIDQSISRLEQVPQ